MSLGGGHRLTVGIGDNSYPIFTILLVCIEVVVYACKCGGQKYFVFFQPIGYSLMLTVFGGGGHCLSEVIY